MSMRVESNAYVKDGTQVWMRGMEVLDITTNDRAKFLAMFGLMQVPNERATRVLISPADYEAMVAAARPTPTHE